MNDISRRGLLVAATASLLATGLPAVAAGGASERPAEALPANSIYQLPIPLVDQDGKAFQLAERRGAPTVVSMFYTSCQFTCPMLVEAIRANEQKLTPGERARLEVVLVSFDPEHDTVQVLRETARSRHVDPARWTLARTDAASARKLAALLGIRYRAVGNGEFNHTSALVLLDANGQIVGRTHDVSGADAAFVKELRQALAAAPR